MSDHFHPRQIALKITRLCNAHCYHCEDRQSFYGPLDKQHLELSLEMAEKVLVYFSKNGLNKITLTGGEPTLCGNLSDFIQLARRYVEHVTLITNGWNNSAVQWKSWLENGLTDVDISIDGHSGALHDWLRNRTGLLKRIECLLEVLTDARSYSSSPRIGVVTLVSGFNILKLDKLLEQLLNWGVDRWVLHYPESDLDGVFSPSIEKQARFRDNILPRLITMISNAPLVDNDRTKAIEQLDRLYDPRLVSPVLAAEGVYHPSIEMARNCDVPGRIVLVKYDGTIHGCIGGDYSDDARIGTVHPKKPIKIDHRAIKKITEDRIAYCRFCPVPKTLRVPLRSSD